MAKRAPRVHADQPDVEPGPVHPAPAALSVKHLSKHFTSRRGTNLVLDDVTLEIAPGEFVCLIGPSGCGKSTLLKIIAGFTSADSGRIVAHGREVTGPGVDRCMLFQSPTLFPWLNARDNVLYGPRARHELRPQTIERAHHMLEIVGLADFADHYPHQLSGGMQHRVALARALMNDPDVLLMDEPFAALDAITRTTMRTFLLSLWQRQRNTIVFVTHDVDEATLLADRVCVMSRGPGRISEVSAVDLPRPRDINDMETMQYLEARRKIRYSLESAMAPHA